MYNSKSKSQTVRNKIRGKKIQDGIKNNWQRKTNMEVKNNWQ